MLAIVSDLHFSDGTAHPKAVSPAAFELLLGEVYALARANKAKNLDIVLLGDSIDLLRTTRWFVDAQGNDVPLADRPWGSADALDDPTPGARTLKIAHDICDGIIADNATALAAFRGEGIEGTAPCPVRRIYIPGNHDRLYLFDPALREKIRKALGAVDENSLGAEGISQHALVMPRYGLVARHGHEWDPWNMARHEDGKLPSAYAAEDYLHVPIGDPITTELVARAPYELHWRLNAMPEFKDTPELDRVYRRMQLIEDVRPTLSAISWLSHESVRLQQHLTNQQGAALMRGARETFRSLALEFKALGFYQAWREKYGRFLRIDITDQLATLLDAISIFDVPKLAMLIDSFAAAPHLEFGNQPNDRYVKGAIQEELDAVSKDGLRFVVYGHTHDPLQVAMRSDPGQDLYLNTGTWRGRQTAVSQGPGFIGWEQCTWLAFYDADEAPDDINRVGPGFETWTGTRKIHDHGSV